MAISTDRQYVIDIAPELEVISTGRMDRFIEIAKLSVAEPVWRAQADYATALLTAHMLTMFPDPSSEAGKFRAGGTGGEVKRKKLGDAEIEFSTSADSGVKAGSNSDHELNQTSYGREFLRVRRTLIITPRVAGGDCCSY